MTTIGSGIAGSIAATPLGSGAQAQQARAEEAEEAAESKDLRRMSDVQEHEVEETEHAEAEIIRPDDRRQKRRRSRGKSAGLDRFEVTDPVDLKSAATAPAAAASAAPTARAAQAGSSPPPADADGQPTSPDEPVDRKAAPPADGRTGRILDIEA